MYTRGGKMNGTNEEELQKMGVFFCLKMVEKWS